MEEMIYSVTLGDGTVLSDLHMNGNNFVSASELTSATFSGKLHHVVISDGTTEQVIDNAELIRLAQENDGWYFVLREIPADVLEKLQLHADIDYIAAMTGVDL